MDGQRLRVLRKAKKITQAKLADILGVDMTLISKWELHGTTPGSKTLDALASYFNVSVDYLMGRDEEPNRQSEKEPATIAGSWLKDTLAEIGKTPDDLEKLAPDEKELLTSLVKKFLQDKPKRG